ncbi:MAG: hypothetical protein LBF24_02265, partial [Puniceicoccales bacterium]|nr:hypothetical protein [Puniceicoccales bacterium]
MQAAVWEASNGDTLLFPGSTFVFSGEVVVESGKSLGLRGAGLSESGQPLTVLEKSEACRFFCFEGNGGGGSGIRSIAFDGKELPVDGYGGAIYCDSNFSGGVQNSSFAGNRVNYDGGAIFCWDDFIGDIQSSSFAGNRSGNDGGAIRCGNNFIGDIQSSSFAGNGANYLGGAIYCNGNFTGYILGSSFADNRSDWNGGAINCNGNFTGAVQSSSFADNWADRYGGAILYWGSCTGKDDAFADLGGSRFLRNGAGILGGAVYCYEDAKLAALSGDVVFQGNWHGAGEPNGLHFANYDDARTIALAAAAGRTFHSYDPISGNTYYDDEFSGFYPHLTVQINPESGHTGTVLFDRHRSDIWFEGADGATVSHGTMVLQNGASFGAGASNFLSALIDSGQDIYDVNDELLESIPANGGPFRLCESATLLIAYGQPIDVYSFHESTFQVESYTQAVPYDPASMRSEINA